LFNIFRNSLGQFDAANRMSDGASVTFDPQTGTFGNDELTIEFLIWRDENRIDLSDIEPDPVFELKNYRINFLLSPDKNIPLFRYPGDINYNTDLIIGLSTKTIDYFGLRVANIYYQTLDAFDSLKPLDNPLPIVLERYYYKWDEKTELPVARVKEVHFYFEDSSLDKQKKILPKEFYNTSDKENIVYYRRKTIISWLIGRSKELGLGDALEGFFSKFKNECDRYILYGDNKILGLVGNSQETWLDIDTQTPMGTVRTTIIFCLGKALEATPEAEIDNFLEDTFTS
jgi:hypothetical protein